MMKKRSISNKRSNNRNKVQIAFPSSFTKTQNDSEEIQFLKSFSK